MFTLERHTGRLVELRIVAPVERPNIPVIAARFREIVAHTNTSLVFATDLRTVGIFPPEAAESFLNTLKNDNPKIERSAFLVGDGALIGMQIERLLREADHPARRAFREATELTLWLSEVLQDGERARLRTFLAAPI